MGETGSRQYAAKGTVSILAERVKNNGKHEVILSLTIQPGWHINANQPKDINLIPTKISLTNNEDWQLEDVIYPESTDKLLGFSQQTLALYEDEIQIKAMVIADENRETVVIPIELNLQACDEQVCLAPEIVKFKLIN